MHILRTWAPMSSERGPIATLNGLQQTQSMNGHIPGTSKAHPDDSGATVLREGTNCNPEWFARHPIFEQAASCYFWGTSRGL